MKPFPLFVCFASISHLILCQTNFLNVFVFVLFLDFHQNYLPSLPVHLYHFGDRTPFDPAKINVLFIQSPPGRSEHMFRWRTRPPKHSGWVSLWFHRSLVIKDVKDSVNVAIISVIIIHHHHTLTLSPSSSGWLSKHQSLLQRQPIITLPLCFLFLHLLKLPSSSPPPCSLPFLLILPHAKLPLCLKVRRKFHHHCNCCHHSRSIYFSPSSKDPYIKHSASSLQEPLH